MDADALKQQIIKFLVSKKQMLIESWGNLAIVYFNVECIKPNDPLETLAFIYSK